MRHRATHVLRMANEESGFVLIQVLAFSLILAMVTIALTNLSMSEYATVNTVDRGIRAFFIADGAVERAITVLRADSNWNDGVGADQNANNASWQPLYDKFQSGGPGNALNQVYPSGGGPGSGQSSVYVRRPDPNSGLNPIDNIWIRATGQAGPATRGVEVLLHRLTPLDFSVYSAQSVLVGNGGGNVTLHGSAYFYQNLGLKAVQTGIYNDRPILSSDAPPYANQLYVRGTLDMSTGNSYVGTASQPMYGVHATNINLKNAGTKNLNTKELDNMVPSVPYPSVQQYIASVLTNNTYGNQLSANQKQMAICTNSSGTWSQTFTTNLAFGSTYFVIPTQAYATCDNNVTNPANNMLIWDPSQAVPLTLNSAFKSSPILVPGVVTVNRNITYSGIATIVAEGLSGPTGLDASDGQILASVPATGSACGYGTPSSMPKTDLLGFIVAGNVLMQGSSNTCGQEQDVVIVAGSSGTSTFSSTKKVQMYGVVITEQLNTSQNPDFYQMPDILQYMPNPLVQLATFNVTMPVVVRQWRELMN